MGQQVKGFSKLSKEGKIEWLIESYFNGDASAIDRLKTYWHHDPKVQKLHDEFTENTLSNFYLPFGVAPNFVINGKQYCIPMAIEESSVVAAAAKAASFWAQRGGFKAEVMSMDKIGHVHFTWGGTDSSRLQAFFDRIINQFHSGTEALTRNMVARGGGIKSLELIDKTADEPNYYQIKGVFDTRDSMGANFINSLLEEFAKILEREIESDTILEGPEKECSVIMCILSNYTPECIVRAEVECPVEDLTGDENADTFAEKFLQAIRIATIEPYRATTHNKGIMNGIDSVILATGNDFRAVEACAHTYASRDGQYRSLTQAEVKDGKLRFWLDIPMAVGTVGGLTSLHPMVKFAHDLLGNPDAEELMKIIAVVGLAQNFGAVRSLVTTGIQKGHMKMHLLNILNQLGATVEERNTIKAQFEEKVVSHQAVVQAFCDLRGIDVPQVNVKK
ncbi:MAG: hydroxymethylglutaryl-CoA reductase, degradative [Bacteroidota bacterium]